MTRAKRRRPLILDDGSDEENDDDFVVSPRPAKTGAGADQLPRFAAKAAPGAAASVHTPGVDSLREAQQPPPPPPPQQPPPQPRAPVASVVSAGVDVSAVVERLRSTRAQVKHVSWVPGRPACHAPAPGFVLPPELGAVLGRARALPLYSHQSEAIAAALAGKSVVVSTPTASGKSICYLAPLLHQLTDEERPTKAGRALVLMPLKALAHDQVRSIRALLDTARACADAAEATGALPTKSIARLRRMASLCVETYDGDVRPEVRADVRRSAVVVVTNVDMLHCALLPHHGSWPKQFWACLRTVVLDESHTYKGVHGSHAALVVRRLRRVCASYGAAPSFVCCSATVANPGQHMSLLTGVVDPVVVTESGAPSGAKALMLWQPPEATQHHHQNAGGVDDAAVKPMRRSAYQEAGDVVSELVSYGIRPLVFVPARKLAEIVAAATRASLRDRGLLQAAGSVESYRAGYSTAERRDLERRLAAGDVSALVSTSALELGIDIGQLDATVHVGVPDTAAQQWQQAGRAGRRGNAPSMAVVVATERPLDLFYLAQPDKLAQRPPEAAHIDPCNLALLQLHVAAAAAELKVVEQDAPVFGGDRLFGDAIRAAVNARALVYEPGIRAYGCALPSPAQGISIRGSTSRETVELHDEALFARRDATAASTQHHPGGGPPGGDDVTTTPASLVEVIEASQAPYKVHPGAVFHYRQSVFEVVSFDPAQRLALGKRVQDTPLTTSARERSTVRQVRVHRSSSVGAAWAALGRCHVASMVTGFVKMNSVTQQTLFERDFPAPGYPALNMETDALWFQLPPEVAARLQVAGTLREACAGLRNLCMALLPSVVACEPGDMGSTVLYPDPNAACDDDEADASVTMYIFDTHGGVGLCAIAFDALESLWRQCLAVCDRCPCTQGCASCTQAAGWGRWGPREAAVGKQATRVLLQGVLGAWMHGARASVSTGTAGGTASR